MLLLFSFLSLLFLFLSPYILLASFPWVIPNALAISPILGLSVLIISKRITPRALLRSSNLIFLLLEPWLFLNNCATTLVNKLIPSTTPPPPFLPLPSLTFSQNSKMGPSLPSKTHWFSKSSSKIFIYAQSNFSILLKFYFMCFEWSKTNLWVILRGLSNRTRGN